VIKDSEEIRNRKGEGNRENGAKEKGEGRREKGEERKRREKGRPTFF
jgi:hypothetical protein